MRLLYTLGFYLAIPFLLLRWLWRSRQNPGYRQRLKQRFGYLSPIDKTASIWLHAVSVGELMAAIPLIKTLIKTYPYYTIVITSTTPTGSAQVLKQFGKQVYHCYFPLDLPGAIRRFLLTVKPHVAIIMETELWPNLLHALNKMNIPTLLANARLSHRSMLSYQKIKNLVAEMLRCLTCVMAQTPQDGEHFLKLGLTNDKLKILGNIKFDMQLPKDIKEQGQALRTQWQSNERPTLIAASTHEGEEIKILQAFSRIKSNFPNALLILVPRHPERFSKVITLCQQQNYTIALRSKNQAVTNATEILIADTMGELRLLYATADVAFVGGSLNTPGGGHNTIEPAALSLPILTGPNTQNFTEITCILSQANALKIVKDATQFADTVIQLFKDKSLATAMGVAAKNVSDSNSGALQKHIEVINQHI